jgi:hypothetical protein
MFTVNLYEICEHYAQGPYSLCDCFDDGPTARVPVERHDTWRHLNGQHLSMENIQAIQQIFA